MKKNLLLLCCLAFYSIATAQLTGPLGMTTAEGTFGQYLSKSQLKVSMEMADKSAAGFSFNNKENTMGTRFLFDNWVKGDSVITKGGGKINVSAYVFNFDKLTGSLLASENRKDILAVNASAISSFELANNNRQYNFDHVNTIDSTKFFLALAKNSERYSLYKLIRVKFIQATYRNDGLIESGNKEDNYKEESQYYIVMPDSTFRLITLKPKVIKDILIKDRDKTNEYFSNHRDDEIDERFVTGLINYVNK